MPDYTPAPWTVETDSEGIFVMMGALHGKDEFIPVYAAPYNEYDREPSYRRIADARLIASAPFLLEALEAVGRAAEDARAERDDLGWYHIQLDEGQVLRIWQAVQVARGEVVPGA